jgi:hypothetical protein
MPHISALKRIVQTSIAGSVSRGSWQAARVCMVGKGAARPCPPPPPPLHAWLLSGVMAARAAAVAAASRLWLWRSSVWRTMVQQQRLRLPGAL